MDSIAADFEGEFDSIRRMSPEEAENDKLFQRIKGKFGLQREEQEEQEEEEEVHKEQEEQLKEHDALAVTSHTQEAGVSKRPSKEEQLAARKRKKYSKVQHITLVDPFKLAPRRVQENPDSDVLLVPSDSESSKGASDGGDVKTIDVSSAKSSQADEVEYQKLPIISTSTQAISQEKEVSKTPAIHKSESEITFTSDSQISSSDSKVIHSPSPPTQSFVTPPEDPWTPEAEIVSAEEPQVESSELPQAEEDENSRKLRQPLESPSASDIMKLRKAVLSQLLGRFTNLKKSSILAEKYEEIYNLFEHTVRDHEGHSTLVIGPRASGKTAVIETALSDLKTKYEGQFVTIRLNALIHSDDNVALREIAKQLDGRNNRGSLKSIDITSESPKEEPSTLSGSLTSLKDEPEVEESAFEQRSINDTFANILSTLDQKLAKDGDRLCIIFIIDEFEKFTSNNNKQTLLYNLFDLSQNSDTPVCVVGVSTRLTVRESLEKRVKSRFSQRIILINKVKSVDEFWKEARLNLILDEEAVTNKEYLSKWNSYIDTLYERSSSLRRLVYQNFFSLKNFKELNNSMIYAVSKVNITCPYPDDSDFSVYQESLMVNNVQGIVNSLSPLELLLTIAAARWVEKFELQVINFNLAYAEYKDMIKNYNVSATGASTSSSGLDSKMLTNFKINHKVWSPGILKNSWEFLYKLGLLLDASGLTTNNDGHIITNTNLNKSLVIEDSRMVQLDITLDELGQLLEDNHMFKKMTML